MSWQVYAIGSIFLVVYALLKTAELIGQRNEGDDATSASIKSGMKVVFIGVALFMSVISLGGTTHIIEGTIDASNNLNNNAEVQEVENTANALYQTGMSAVIVLVSFLTIFVIYMSIRQIRRSTEGKL